VLLSLAEHLKPSNSLSLPHKGEVVYNADPLKLGRIKVAITGLLEPLDENFDSLPWMFPDAKEGGRNDSGSISIPDLGDEVRVIFPTRDIYAGVYTGAWMSETTFPAAMRKQYPQTAGKTDAIGNKTSHNKETGESKFEHVSGSSARFENDGSVIVSGKKKITLESTDGASSIILDFENGTFTQRASNESILQGEKQTVEVDEINLTTSSLTEEIKGGHKKDVVGGRKLAIGGDESKAVTGNRALTVAGKTSELHTDQSDVTYGTGKKETVVLGNSEEQLLAGNKQIDLLLGNFLTSIIAGNFTAETKAGALKLANLIGSIEVDIAGNLNGKGLMMTMEGMAMGTVKAPLLMLNSGAAPIVTIMSDPIEDFVTGKPKLGIATILAGP